MIFRMEGVVRNMYWIRGFEVFIEGFFGFYGGERISFVVIVWVRLDINGWRVVVYDDSFIGGGNVEESSECDDREFYFVG